MSNPIYIPTYIGSVDYKPARVQPRILFYNGLKSSEQYYVSSGSAIIPLNSFPYFDNYSGAETTTASLSLLFNNEVAPYGDIPTSSLYTEYWEDYVELLYAPTTRLVNCSAVIPLAAYFEMDLNDLVNLRGNTYHLRSINNYNLTTGECDIQLLGPILEGAFSRSVPRPLPPGELPEPPVGPVEPVEPTTTTTTSTTTTTTTTTTSTTTTTTTTTAPPDIYTHGAVRATCSDYCNTNYLIETATAADSTYLGLTIGDIIYGQSGAGFVAYSNVQTDTVTGPFRIAEIDEFGTIISIFVCSGGSCLEL
jgi:hypothetical protein